TVTGALGTLAGGATATLMVTAQAVASGTFADTADVSSTAGDSDAGFVTTHVGAAPVDPTVTVAPGTAHPTFNHPLTFRPPLTATLSGFLNGDTAAVVTGTAGLSTTATPTSPVGTYPIVVGPGTLSAANYDVAFTVNGTLTVTKAHLTVTADNKSRNLGGAN